MITSSQSLRKAAILVASLDRDTADALLDQMPDEQASQLRQMMMAIDDISETESSSAIHDFLQIDDSELPAVDIEENPIHELSRAPGTHSPPATVEPTEASLSWHLQNTSDAVLVDILRGELPQTISIVLAQVPAVRASEIVAKLPAANQADILQRIVEADRLSISLDDVIANEFESWLTGRLDAAHRRSQLVDRLSTIVGAASEDAQQRILANLAATDISLSRELGYDEKAHDAEESSLATS